jgi:hypothetical protein
MKLYVLDENGRVLFEYGLDLGSGTLQSFADHLKTPQNQIKTAFLLRAALEYCNKLINKRRLP